MMSSSSSTNAVTMDTSSQQDPSTITTLLLQPASSCASPSVDAAFNNSVENMSLFADLDAVDGESDGGGGWLGAAFGTASPAGTEEQMHCNGKSPPGVLRLHCGGKTPASLIPSSAAPAPAPPGALRLPHGGKTPASLNPPSASPSRVMFPSTGEISRVRIAAWASSLFGGRQRFIVRDVFGLLCLRRIVHVNGEIDRTQLRHTRDGILALVFAKDKAGPLLPSGPCYLGTDGKSVLRQHDVLHDELEIPAVKIQPVHNDPLINVQNGNKNNLFSKEENGAINADRLYRKAAYVTNLSILERADWDKCGNDVELGRTYDEHKSCPIVKQKANEASRLMHAMDLFPYTRLLNQDGVAASARYLRRTFAIKHVSNALGAYKCALKALKCNSSNLKEFMSSGVFADDAEFQLAQSDLAMLMDTSEKLKEHEGAEERATRLLAACLGLALAALDQKIESLGDADPKPPKGKKKGKDAAVNALQQENTLLKATVLKRTRELEKVKSTLKKLKLEHNVADESDDDSGTDSDGEDDDIAEDDDNAEDEGDDNTRPNNGGNDSENSIAI